MLFTVNTVTRCAGQNHWAVNLTVAGGPTVTIQTTTDELQFNPQASLAETRDYLLLRLRSAAKEAGAATLAQIKTALEGKSFQL